MLAGASVPRLYRAGMRDTRSLLLELLGAGAVPTQEEAARRLRVSPRTARRHLRRLERDGLVEVVKDGAYKRYRVVLAHRVMAPQQVRLTEGEAEALTVAVLAARSLLAPTPFGTPLATAHDKLERAWLSETFSFEPEAEPSTWSFDEVTGGTPNPFDTACFEGLLDAVRNRRPVRVTYRTASRNATSTDRLLHPLGFLVRAGAWMVVAVDPAVPGATACVKDFALAGFDAVVVDDAATFTPPSDFNLALHARDRFRALAGDDVYEVRLLVEAEAAPYFRRKQYHPTQQVEAERPGGRLVVSFEAEGLDDLTSWVLSWGAKLRVLAPDALAERVAAAHRAAADLYARQS